MLVCFSIAVECVVQVNEMLFHVNISICILSHSCRVIGHANVSTDLQV
jgi:hypothetical protein